MLSKYRNHFDIHIKDLNTCHLAKTIGLHFFDAIHIEAKSASEETTGELSLYTHLTVSEAYDYQKCLVYEAFRIIRYSKVPWFTLRYLTIIYKDVCRKIVPVVQLGN